MVSKTEEGLDVARHFVSPVVLHSLVDRLVSYRPPVHTESPRGRVGKYGKEPSSPPPVSAEEEGSPPPPPPTDTEDLVVKLLACLMVHPQQGQRARLVLREDLPEALYMSLHQAGSVPADVKGESAKALPPLPDRDTDNKLYPKKSLVGAGAARSVLATGNAKAPISLAVPLCIVVTPPDEFEVEREEYEVEVEEEAAAVVSAGSGGVGQRPTQRSLKRSLVAALSPHPNASESGGWDGSSRMPSLVSAGMNTPGSRSSGKLGSSRGLWQRASTGWSSSVPNTPGTTDASEERRPLTLSPPNGQRGTSLGLKKRNSSKAKSASVCASSLSPTSPRSPRSPGRQGSINWAGVARALSPGVVQQPESGGK